MFYATAKKTIFYLFITTEKKAFDTKNFSNALGISRVSFGPPATVSGSAFVFAGAG